jgi:hypothetical protein
MDHRHPSTVVTQTPLGVNTAAPALDVIADDLQGAGGLNEPAADSCSVTTVTASHATRLLSRTRTFVMFTAGSGSIGLASAPSSD